MSAVSSASVAALAFCSIVMFEMSVASTLFQFLVALCPSEQKAIPFVRDLKLVLESAGEGCFL